MPKPARRVVPPDPQEQIDLILGQELFRWAVRSLPEGIRIDDLTFRDFITVSEADVLDFVLLHGFDSRGVWVEGDSTFQDDHICIEGRGDKWRVFYTERGIERDEATFGDREAAIREVVGRLWSIARVGLNHRYWHAQNLQFPCDVDEPPIA